MLFKYYFLIINIVGSVICGTIGTTKQRQGLLRSFLKPLKFDETKEFKGHKKITESSPSTLSSSLSSLLPASSSVVDGRNFQLVIWKNFDPFKNFLFVLKKWKNDGTNHGINCFPEIPDHSSSLFYDENEMKKPELNLINTNTDASRLSHTKDDKKDIINNEDNTFNRLWHNKFKLDTILQIPKLTFRKIGKLSIDYIGLGTSYNSDGNKLNKPVYPIDERDTPIKA